MEIRMKVVVVVGDESLLLGMMRMRVLLWLLMMRVVMGWYRVVLKVMREVMRWVRMMMMITGRRR